MISTYFSAAYRDKLCDFGALSKKRGPKPNLEAKAQQRIAQLERELNRTKEQLRQAEVVIEVQKNIRILGIKQPPEADWKTEKS